MNKLLVKNKWIQLVGAGALALTLAACGDEETKEDQTSSDPNRGTGNGHARK